MRTTIKTFFSKTKVPTLAPGSVVIARVDRLLRSAPYVLVQPLDVVEKRLSQLRKVLGLTQSPELEKVKGLQLTLRCFIVCGCMLDVVVYPFPPNPCFFGQIHVPIYFEVCFCYSTSLFGLVFLFFSPFQLSDSLSLSSRIF